MATSNHPRVCVAVIVVKGGKVLFGRPRKGPWHLPLGELERYEEIAQAASRRVRECTGVVVNGVQHLTFREEIDRRRRRHDILHFVLSRHVRGELPHDGEQWEWFDPRLLPHPLFNAQGIFDPATIRKIRQFCNGK